MGKVSRHHHGKDEYTYIYIYIERERERCDDVIGHGNSRWQGKNTQGRRNGKHLLGTRPRVLSVLFFFFKGN